MHEVAHDERIGLTVESLGSDASEWDAYVARTAGASFCHLSAWRDILESTMGHRPHYLVARSDTGEIHGVLPLALIRSPGFGRRLISLPLLSYGGPVGTPAAMAALVARALHEARRERAALELRARHPVPCQLTPHYRKLTVVLPLPDSAEQLMATLRSKLRSQIRRPQKEGMSVRFGPDQVGPFYHVLQRNMRDLGTPVLPLPLFEAIAHSLPETVTFAVVYHGPRPVAAGAGFAFRGEFEITWASALREYSRSAPNMLLYWSLMESMIQRGIRTFNFGRCTPGEGTHRFKQQWGGIDEPLPWLSWSGGSGDGAPGVAARTVAEAWRRLPYAVANRLGPVIARRLPWW